jgi:hypothetical protein
VKPPDNSSGPLASRPWLKVLFWCAVAAAWGLALGSVAFIGLIVFFAGRPSPVQQAVSRGLAADEVVARVGKPTREFEDASRWFFIINDSDECATDSISSAWLYSYMFQDDSMVYLDDQGRVVCVHSGGKIIYHVSH